MIVRCSGCGGGCPFSREMEPVENEDMFMLAESLGCRVGTCAGLLRVCVYGAC